MENSEFHKQYARLNSQQKKAVDLIDGPVMVMAGPGTGKTQVLACRVANILHQQDVEPHNILALTFTDAAAQNMRERIVKMIGTTGYYVRIMTFHSFASEIISEYPDKFPINQGSEALTDYERFQIFEDIFLNTNFQKIKPLNSPLYYVKEVIKRISELKRENITPEKFETILVAEEAEFEQEKVDLKKSERIKKEKNLLKQRDLLLAYTKYQSALLHKKRFDFDDMILFTVKALESDEDLLLDYQEQFHYFLVDEYQDTNSAQNKIVELLASHWQDQPNLFVVGDPHQSIFRFQGASTENMLQFINKYPNTTVITLEIGYRCHESVYTAAHELISNNELSFSEIAGNLDPQATKVLDTALFKKLNSHQKLKENKEKAKISLFVAESEVHELLFVAEEIKRLIDSGIPASEISVLYRNNFEAEKIRDVLEHWNVPVQKSVGENVLDDMYIQQLIQLLTLIRDSASGEVSDALFEVMLYPWISVENVIVYKFAFVCSKLKKDFIDLLHQDYVTAQNLFTKRYPDLDFPLKEIEYEQLQHFWSKILKWYSLLHSMLFHEWFSLIINKDNTAVDSKLSGFGFMEFILDIQASETVLATNSLYAQIKNFVSTDRTFSLESFLSILITMQEHSIKIPVESIDLSAEKVELTTVHSSKGKEWQYVFCIGIVDKKWGNTRNRELLPLPDSILVNTDISKKEKNEDDRRLFYVAITRSSKETIISYPKQRIDGKELLASMFITELQDAKLSEQTKKSSEQVLSQIENLLTSVNLEYQSERSADEIAFFKQLVANFKLSVTALNSYLQDPKEFMVNSLLRVPRAKSPVLAFGTATHYALEKFNKRLQYPDKKKLTKAEFLSEFEYALQQEFLDETDFQERKSHGMEVLTKYYEEVLSLSELQRPLYVEKYFGGKLSKAVLFDKETEIQLSGRIDKVELIDKKLKNIRVIDYKTGTPKSKNVILGQSGTQNYSERELLLPETIRGRYQRQLVFYKLLAELNTSFPYVVTEAVFDFVEPGGSHKDKHISRSFFVSDQAVEDLKKLIKEVMREIRELKFLTVDE